MPENVLKQAVTAPDTVAPDTTHNFHAPLYADGFPVEAAADSAPPPIADYAVMPLPRRVTPGERGQSLIHDTTTMGLLITALFCLALSYRHGYKYIESLLHKMFSVRRRESIFNDNTVKETQILSALVSLTCILEGILCYQALRLWQPQFAASMQQSPGLYTLAFCGVALAFYLFQLVLFQLLGYVFTDSENTHVWLEGFKSSQAALGLALLPVACVSLAAPRAVGMALTLAVVLYVCARIVFVSKGFRIFYTDFLSIIYFILYLCAAEIVPSVLACGTTVAICHYFQS